MVDTFLINEKERPDLSANRHDDKRQIPGVGAAPRITTLANSVTKFLGRLDGEGPWVYYKTHGKGDAVPFHRHTANRVEFVIEGRIEWRERGKDPKIYGAGTLSYVEAGTLYGYAVLEDAKILTIFDSAPGFSAV